MSSRPAAITLPLSREARGTQLCPGGAKRRCDNAPLNDPRPPLRKRRALIPAGWLYHCAIAPPAFGSQTDSVTLKQPVPAHRTPPVRSSALHRIAPCCAGARCPSPKLNPGCQAWKLMGFSWHVQDQGSSGRL